MVRASEVTRVEIEDDDDRRAHGRGRGVNQILDDALGAFIDVLDQHTLADMAKGQRIPGVAAPQARGRAKPVAGSSAACAARCTTAAERYDRRAADAMLASERRTSAHA